MPIIIVIRVDMVISLHEIQMKILIYHNCYITPCMNSVSNMDTIFPDFDIWEQKIGFDVACHI